MEQETTATMENDPAIQEAKKHAEYWQKVFDDIGGKIAADEVTKRKQERADYIKRAAEKAAAEYDSTHRTEIKNFDSWQEMAAALPKDDVDE